MKRWSAARPWLSVTGGVAGLVGVALLALVLGYLLPLLRGVGVLEGASLPSQPLGRLLFAEQMAREFDCQGVQHTRHGTWLVASQNDAGYAVDLPHDEAPPLALESLLPQPPQNTATFAARRARSFVSRLDEQGVFRLLASVPATACLLASTADDTLWLLTDLPRPANSSVEQTVIFRSVDQGRTWHWLEPGLFPGVSAFALDLAPQQVFLGTDNGRAEAACRGRRAGAPRRRAAFLDTGVHVGLVVVTDVGDLLASVECAGQGLQADVGGGAVTGEADDMHIFQVVASTDGGGDTRKHGARGGKRRDHGVYPERHLRIDEADGRHAAGRNDNETAFAEHLEHPAYDETTAAAAAGFMADEVLSFRQRLDADFGVRFARHKLRVR